MVVSLKSKPPASATVSKAVSNKGVVLSEVVNTETGKIPDFNNPATKPVVGPFCEVGFEGSYTHNLGDFKSCKVGISLKIPCQHSELDKVFDYAEEWVDKRLTAMRTELENS